MENDRITMVKIQNAFKEERSPEEIEESYDNFFDEDIKIKKLRKIVLDFLQAKDNRLNQVQIENEDKDGYSPINEKNDDNIKNEIINEEDNNKQFNVTPELINNNNSMRNEINNEIKTDSFFDFDVFLGGGYERFDENKINFKEDNDNSEDFKTETEINNYINQSLIDNIEDPYIEREKEGKSRFFKYDFFADKED